jgi:hAT family C-terminal dimerisation region
MKFRGKSHPFLEFEFSSDVTAKLSAVQWWRSHRDDIDGEVLATIVRLLTAVASSAGVERVFSSYGLVHSKLRNRLGTEKAAKLVFLFKAINQQNTAFDE